IVTRAHAELDLTNQAAVKLFFEQEKPDQVYLAAAKVGGIHANNTYPAEFIYDNLMVQNNVIHQAFLSGVKKLLFLGSSCIYPKMAPQPIGEDALLMGKLEPTNEPYAIAKIAGIKMCQAYQKQYGFNAISIMPTNLYGPNDNFDLNSSHVVPALIRKFHDAKINNFNTVTLWGTGTPKREFLHVDDMADASIFLMQNYDDPDIINVGVGHDVTILELAEMIRKVIGFKGDIFLDQNKPDGTPRKLLDTSKINNLGWRAKIDLENGITSTYKWYLKFCKNSSKIKEKGANRDVKWQKK
ncbi:MAG: GDP-L-fucose synthase, partial [Desulfamplus sp.]|nr:GDP-L-fucose synthase [Desulfamplus sp.]